MDRTAPARRPPGPGRRARAVLGAPAAVLVAALVVVLVLGAGAVAQSGACRNLRVTLQIGAFQDQNPSARGAGVTTGDVVRLTARVRGGQLPPGARIVILRQRLDRFGRIVRGDGGVLPRFTCGAGSEFCFRTQRSLRAQGVAYQAAIAGCPDGRIPRSAVVRAVWTGPRVRPTPTSPGTPTTPTTPGTPAAPSQTTYVNTIQIGNVSFTYTYDIASRSASVTPTGSIPDAPGSSSGPTPVPVTVSGQLPPGYTLVIVGAQANPVAFTSLPASTTALPPFAGFQARTSVSFYICQGWGGGLFAPGTACGIPNAGGGVSWTP